MILPNIFNALVSDYKIYKTKERQNCRIASYSKKLLECLRKSQAEGKTISLSFQTLSTTNPGAFLAGTSEM